jgi:hypothetical protein
MWRRVDIVLTDPSEERIASIFRVEEKRRKICEQGTSVSRSSALARGFSSFLFDPEDGGETSVETISTRLQITEDCFVHSHRREHLYLTYVVRLNRHHNKVYTRFNVL